MAIDEIVLLGSSEDQVRESCFVNHTGQAVRVLLKIDQRLLILICKRRCTLTLRYICALSSMYEINFLRSSPSRQLAIPEAKGKKSF